MPTVTQSSGSGMMTHEIELRGRAGAMFAVVAVATVLIVVGYATTGWSMYEVGNTKTQYGLWETCVCHSSTIQEPWFKAVQAMITIGLILSFASLLLVFIYTCIHIVNKNITIILFIAITFASVVFMLIGIIIYGVRAGRNPITPPSFSFAFAIIGTALCLAAGVLAIIQMRKSNNLS